MIPSFSDFIVEQQETSSEETYVSRQNEFNKMMAMISINMARVFPLWKTYIDNMTIARVIPVKIEEKQPVAPPLQNQITIVDRQITTMAVDAKGNMFVNEQWALELPFNQAFGVVCHEIMHVVQFHLQRKESFRDMKVWNFATDYVINWQLMYTLNVKLPQEGLHAEPKTGLINLPELTKPVSVLDRSGKIRTAEEVYSMLVDAGMKTDEGEGGSGEGGDGEGGDGEGGSGEGGDGDGGEPKNFDQHIYDDKLGDLAKKQGQTPSRKTRDEWDQIKQDAMVQDPTARGSKTGGVYDLQRASQPDTDWKKVLSDVVHDMFETKSSYSKLRRGSYAIRAPLKGRYKTKPKMGEILCAIDTSGSTMNWQSLFLAEIHSLSNTFNVPIRTLMWDTEVGKDITLAGRSWLDNKTKQRIGKDDVIEVTGGGGTDISCVKDYIEQNVVRPKLIIYFTDGYVEPNPKFYAPGAAKHVFLITPGGDANPFNNIGTVVNIQAKA